MHNFKPCPINGKHRYGSERLALAKLEAILADPTPQFVKKPSRVYLCECGKWHLTSKPLLQAAS